MKKIQTIFLTAVSACMIQACHSPDQKWDSKSSADTLNNMKDSVADSNKSITKDLVMKVGKDDAKFAVAAATDGMAEVELGRLALQKAVNSQIKDFGTMMVSDHSKANADLKGLAQSKGITLPATLDNGEQQIKEILSGKSGADFDKAYVEDMIEDHQKDIKDFQDAIAILKDADLKAFAQKTLPTLKMHLAAVQKIHDQLK